MLEISISKDALAGIVLIGILLFWTWVHGIWP
jgi:hypothetical protein